MPPGPGGTPLHGPVSAAPRRSANRQPASPPRSRCWELPRSNQGPTQRARVQTPCLLQRRPHAPWRPCPPPRPSAACSGSDPARWQPPPPPCPCAAPTAYSPWPPRPPATMEATARRAVSARGAAGAGCGRWGLAARPPITPPLPALPAAACRRRAHQGHRLRRWRRQCREPHDLQRPVGAPPPPPFGDGRAARARSCRAHSPRDPCALQGVEFWAVNTDAQALENHQALNKLQIGAQLTRGLGALRWLEFRMSAGALRGARRACSAWPAAPGLGGARASCARGQTCKPLFCISTLAPQLACPFGCREHALLPVFLSCTHCPLSKPSLFRHWRQA